MIKILAVSDTHRSIDNLRAAIELNPDVDYVFHMGDGIADLDAVDIPVPYEKIIRVRGNCDLNRAPWQIVESIGGCRILAVHGHVHDVKESIDRLVYTALDLGIDAVFFGHTHRPIGRYEEGVFMLNPGSLADKIPTYAIVTLDGGKFTAEHRALTPFECSPVKLI